MKFSSQDGTIWASDGRTRADQSKKYGSGGLAQGKKFMLSYTWNAPVEALTDPSQFFQGKGGDSIVLRNRADTFVPVQRRAQESGV